MVGEKLVEAASFEDNTITWANNRITFAQDSQAGGGKVINGALEGYWPGGINLKGASRPDYDVPFRGRYLSFSFEKNRWKPDGDLSLEERAIRIGQKRVEEVVFTNNLLHWSGAGGEMNHGEIQFSIDPTTQLPKFVGYVWEADSRPKNPNLQGTYALEGTNGSSRGNGRGHAVGVKPPVPVGNTKIPARVFEILGTIGLEGSDPTSLFIWSRWQRACFTSRLTNSFVPKILEVIAGNESAKS
jgi:hypothetical protein